MEHVNNFAEASAEHEIAARYASGDYLNQHHAAGRYILVRTIDEQLFDPYSDHLTDEFVSWWTEVFGEGPAAEDRCLFCYSF
jgi:hypothetical protein